VKEEKNAAIRLGKFNYQNLKIEVALIAISIVVGA
jgi:hypothetical protein